MLTLTRMGDGQRLPEFDDGYVRTFVDVPGVGPVLHVWPRHEVLRPGEVEVDLGADPLELELAAVAMRDLLRPRDGEGR